jgi:beta-phosphoglucomutase
MIASVDPIIILDFDGTLVESVGIKDDAFRALFQSFPDHLSEIMAYHTAHNAVLRFEKFRYITETILGLHYTEADKERLSVAFHELIFDGLTACPEVPGALAFLQYYHRRTPMYLVSKSPDEEFHQIIRARGLFDYFTAIYAGSWDKPDAIRHILAHEKRAPHEAVFIGDTPEDLAAATDANVSFIGRYSGRDFVGGSALVFADMAEVHRHLMGNKDLA